THLFGLLFATAARTLLDLGDDPRRLGARLGITAVLHTWTRELLFHPHLHCIVTGGGLTPSGDTWLPLGRRYLFPVQVMGALFRGKFLAGLRRLYDDGRLRLVGGAARLADPAAFARLLDKLYRTDWVVYAKRPFAGAQHVFRY
ncbi:MAG: transposase, partial [Proteobacteria bacterium]|nr:transposase [Pseudomonadota bacterium]